MKKNKSQVMFAIIHDGHMVVKASYIKRLLVPEDKAVPKCCAIGKIRVSIIPSKKKGKK